jgi:hypothetical protein
MYDDSSPSFFGLNFFLNEPWVVPPGLISTYHYPSGTSLVYSDSFPLIGLFLKLFRSFHAFSLPVQFVGWWILLCIFLQGFFSFTILKRETGKSWFSFWCAIPLMAMPFFYYRSLEPTRHFALMGHFFVLIALGELISWVRRREFRFWTWTLTLVLSLGIHFYLFSMVALSYLVILIQSWIELPLGRKSVVKRNFLLGVLLAFFGIFYGYTGVKVSETTGGGFGLFAMDSFSWFLSDGKATLLPFPFLQDLGPKEGFQYLGMGFILGVFVLLYRLRQNGEVFKKWVFENRYVFFFFIFIFAFAISRRFWIFGTRLSIFITIPLWYCLFYYLLKKLFFLKRIHAHLFTVLMILFYNLLGTFCRSSGRMGWLSSYLICFVFFIFVSQQMRKSFVFLMLFLPLQLVDVYPLLNHVKIRFQSIRSGNAAFSMNSEVLAFSERLKNQVIVISSEYFQDTEINYLALVKNIPIGPVYLARHDHASRFELLNTWKFKIKSKSIAEGDFVLISKEDENSELIEQVKKDPWFVFLERPHSFFVTKR